MRSYGRLLWLAIAIWVGGAIPLGLAAYATVSAIFAPLDRFVAPGSVRERLEKGDERAVLIQTAGSRDARLSIAEARAVDLRCTVRGDGGPPVRPHRVGGYSVWRNEDTYVAALAFTAPASGSYRIACDPRQPLPLAVSRRLHIGRMLGLGFAALGLCAATIMVGVKIARRARRARAPGPEAPGSPIPP